ncbi:hypothetical protein [Bosea lathyri]|uniref:Uncharacterized protein n=1 Tax=Bosea lathyri TaxID=1036778 RepID=A0A1H6D9R2_9HYPH|nr:hypothetical protein [Bosea lathyri]SEG81999.1 hypothetical protein SAMN04488115_11955 [Bosea lathyri]
MPLTCFGEVAKRASFLGESEPKTVAVELPPQLAIAPEPVLAVFGMYAAHGAQFSKVTLFMQGGRVVLAV